MAKERDLENAHNLKNIDRKLYDLIDKYNINQQYLAEKVFHDQWMKAETEGDEEVKNKQKRMLAGRMRNKILGFGKLHPDEYSRLQQALSDIADDMRKTVDESITKKKLVDKVEAKKFLERIDRSVIQEYLEE